MPDTTNNIPYIIAVSVMVMMGIFGTVIITISRPLGDNSGVIATIFGLLVPTTMSLLSFMKSGEAKVVAQGAKDQAEETHQAVNSKLDGMIQASSDAATAQGLALGIAQGTQEANARTDALAAQK